MGEIRLICPGCAAEYRLADGAIPPAGRQVECTACGHVWFQPGTEPAHALKPAAAPVPRATPEPAPPLHRPLPDDVLSILREEAAREHQARAREMASAPDGTGQAPLDLAAAGTAPETDVDWPATTVTDGADSPAPAADGPAPTKVPTSARPAPAAQPAPVPRPAPASDSVTAAPMATGGVIGAAVDSAARHIHDRPASPPGASPPEEMAQTVTRTTPSLSPPPAASPQAARPARTQYHRGFQWGLLLALALLTLYLAAPFLADQGTVGTALMELHDRVDDARLWLFDHATALVDPLIHR